MRLRARQKLKVSQAALDKIRAKKQLQHDGIAIESVGLDFSFDASNAC